MHVKTRTLGRQTSKLFVELNQLNKTTFRLRDVEKITGLRGTSARTLMHKAVRRGLVTRLRPLHSGSVRTRQGDRVRRRSLRDRPRTCTPAKILRFSCVGDGASSHGYSAPALHLR